MRSQRGLLRAAQSSHRVLWKPQLHQRSQRKNVSFLQNNGSAPALTGFLKTPLFWRKAFIGKLWQEHSLFKRPANEDSKYTAAPNTHGPLVSRKRVPGALPAPRGPELRPRAAGAAGDSPSRRCHSVSVLTDRLHRASPPAERKALVPDAAAPFAPGPGKTGVICDAGTHREQSVCSCQRAISILDLTGPAFCY